jgi:hypothetical protein
MSEDYIKQLEEENAALKKKLEEKAIEEYPHNRILNLKSLNEITEENPLIITDTNDKVVCKLVSAYRNKRSANVIIKVKTPTGWLFKSWKCKEMVGWFDDWCAYPVTSGGQSSDKVNGRITGDDIDRANGFFRMIESVGLIDRDDKRVGL